VLLGSNGTSYTVIIQSDACIYAHILHNIRAPIGQKKYKLVAAVNASCQGDPEVRQPYLKSMSGMESVNNVGIRQQCTCDVTLRRVRATSVAVEKQ